MEQRLVSVIIPIYKVSEYLDECVQSVCNQTYQNLEIVLVDDGSPDDCPQKCDAWAQKDSRIRVIHKKNGGLSDARNAGLDAATGKYIYFLDGDDYIKPELVETAVRHMDDGMDMVAFHYDKVSADGPIKSVFYHELGMYDLRGQNKRHDFIIQKLLCGKIGWEAWSRMYSRDIIERYNLRFADNRRIFAEDLYFCLCYCVHADKVVSIANSLYCYLQREDSIMGQDGAKLNIGRMNELAKAALEHFRKWDDCNALVNCFPVIHYLIIDNVFSRALWNNKLSPREFRDNIMADIDDIDFFQTQIKQLPRYRDDLAYHFSGSQVEEKISYMRYLVDGNFTAFRIRNRIIYKFSDLIDHRTKPMRLLRDQYKEIRRYTKRVFLLGTEEFGNIGDHQINEAVVAFLHETLPEYYIHEVTAREWRTHRVFLEKTVRPEDLIVFAGGGNFGDMYPVAQNLRTEVIRLWPANPKIVFPQTIDFSSNSEGEKMLAEACMTYTRENRIALFAREQQSFAFAQAHFSCDSYLVPDIVLSSEVSQESSQREKIILCFRRDVEKAVSEDTAMEIEKACMNSGLPIERTDLQLDYHVDKISRKEIISEKLDLWRQAKVLITDRLHGMVFAAITGTPCIVFSNSNHKVRGTYEWIKYLPYIRYAESAADVDRYLSELLAMENCQYDKTPLLTYFEELAKVVREYANN